MAPAYALSSRLTSFRTFCHIHEASLVRFPATKESLSDVCWDRIFIMGEMYGSMPYVQTQAERIKGTIAAMCVDTPAGLYHLAGRSTPST